MAVLVDTKAMIPRMFTPQPPDSHHLSAAIGWVELGNPAEARLELSQLSTEARGSADALEVEWVICAEERDWQSGLAAANALVQSDPERPTGWLHRSYALRRVTGGGLQAAWDSLLPALEKFPEEPVIPYNLSCYACQLGHLDQARTWLRRALAIGGVETIKRMALHDADLQPIWDELDRI
jgi:predicted Zn-dependent protease